jgi:hypothetical protein
LIYTPLFPSPLHRSLSLSLSLLLLLLPDPPPGYSVDQICKLTCIDKWFLSKLKKISDLEKNLKILKSAEFLTPEKMLEAKKLGTSSDLTFN